MLSANDFSENTDRAHKLFEQFVQKFRVFYKKVGINVHNLLHLRECVNTFGSINSFSAYPFENYIHRISRLVRGKKLVIQQISNRVAE